MEAVSERFLRYVALDTQSDEFSESCPSTAKQRILGDMLVKELQEIGLADAKIDENGYVYATLPGDPNLPTIGLIAHMDTSPDTSGKDVKAKVVCYEGGDILLNEQEQIWLREKDYESLSRNVGKHLIVTDGTTLLGADDKAGIAEIMACVEQLAGQAEPHATVKVAFTPDEEIGRGADLFDVPFFGADYAYTVDGGALGEIEYENFNAAGAKVTVKGKNIHPGSAKNKMVNSQNIAMELHSLLPVDQRPEHTEGYEGFFHLTDICGDVEQTVLRYIIRDHDGEKFAQKKELLTAACRFINSKYGQDTACLEMKDSYYNMRGQIEPCMYIVERAQKAMKAVGIEPVSVPIRGGTDGARLSFMGLPCPNLCTGGENFHGRFEYIPVEDMEAITKMLVQLLTNVN